MPPQKHFSLFLFLLVYILPKFGHPSASSLHCTTVTNQVWLKTLEARVFKQFFISMHEIIDLWLDWHLSHNRYFAPLVPSNGWLWHHFRISECFWRHLESHVQTPAEQARWYLVEDQIPTGNQALYHSLFYWIMPNSYSSRSFNTVLWVFVHSSPTESYQLINQRVECVFMKNGKWCDKSNIETWSCSSRSNLECQRTTCRSHHLPWEFNSVIIAAVYIPPQAHCYCRTVWSTATSLLSPTQPSLWLSTSRVQTLHRSGF